MTRQHDAPPLLWRPTGAPDISDDLDDHNAAVVRAFSRLIRRGQREAVTAALKHWPPSHLVALFVYLPLRQARVLLHWLDPRQVRVVAELNPAFRGALLEAATVQRLVEVLDGLEPEDAADALDDLPPAVVDEVLPRLREQAAIVARRSCGRESAGGIMSHKFVAVPPDWNIGQVVDAVRAHAPTIGKFYAVNVVDAEQRPLGYLRLRDLLLAPREALVHDVMNTDFVAVSADTDQERVAAFADRHALSVVPVVDADGRLVGRITAKQLHRVIREEAEEDRKLMAGLPAGTRPEESVGRIVRGRLPWLLIGLAGASLSATVVGAFEGHLTRAAILASFIPIVMSMAGNAGIQAATVAVQGLSTGTITFADLGWRLLKELAAALANGGIAALVLAGLVLGVARFTDLAAPLPLALVAGVALLCVITLAVAIGATVPLVLDRLGIDPAMATGVFITTGNDILSVLIFFLLVSLLYF